MVSLPLAVVQSLCWVVIWDGSDCSLARLRGALGGEDAGRRHPPWLGDVLGGLDDETLARAIRRGFFPHLAFDLLLATRYWGALRAWFRRWGADPQREVDLELIQSTFLLLWTRYSNGRWSFDEERGSFFRAYLRQTAYRVWLDYLRRQGRSPQHGPLEYDVPGAELDPAVQAEYRELVEAWLQTLSAEDRPLGALLVEGYQGGRLADTLGLPLPMVYRQSYRLRGHLRSFLIAYHHPVGGL